ncbi:cornifelin homolog B-like [Brachionichthys hirsutus]|uniref:cornifelin homolog B-like n=1 Tax=Brachionichthys hirsutus TaxID=412623 RepID=UPI0036054854
MAVLPMTTWSTGLLDCCEDANTCCYGFWCCPCLACSLSGHMGENSCLPLCDVLSPAILSNLGVPMCVPPAGLAVRVGMRHKFAIQGSYCRDIATACCCAWCSWCQMRREWRYRTKTVVTVNMQPGPVMMGPGPVMMAPAQYGR